MTSLLIDEADIPDLTGKVALITGTIASNLKDITRVEISALIYH
jgi:hypothetical protein